MKKTGLFTKIYKFNSLDSTNIRALQLAHAGKLQVGEVVFAFDQTKGKGLKEKSWKSETGKNLIFSGLVDCSMKVDQQFLLNKMLALALKEYLDSLSVGKTSIKWPNDILVNGKKIAGILIENSVSGDLINFSVLGVGLNVNQTEFPDFDRPATSIALQKGRSIDLENALNQTLSSISSYMKLLETNPTQLSQAYLEALYGFDRTLTFMDKEGRFEGLITSVLPDGRLELNREGKLKSYNLKELVFIS